MTGSMPNIIINQKARPVNSSKFPTSGSNKMDRPGPLIFFSLSDSPFFAFLSISPPSLRKWHPPLSLSSHSMPLSLPAQPSDHYPTLCYPPDSNTQISKLPLPGDCRTTLSWSRPTHVPGLALGMNKGKMMNWITNQRMKKKMRRIGVWICSSDFCTIVSRIFRGK